MKHKNDYKVGDQVVMEHPHSLNQIVGRLVNATSKGSEWEYTLETDDGSLMTISGTGEQNWRIRTVAEEWHPRDAPGIELRERLFELGWMVMDARQDMEMDLAMGLKPEYVDERRRRHVEGLRTIEQGVFSERPEGWRDRYMHDVKTGWS